MLDYLRDKTLSRRKREEQRKTSQKETIRSSKMEECYLHDFVFIRSNRLGEYMRIKRSSSMNRIDDWLKERRKIPEDI